MLKDKIGLPLELRRAVKKLPNVALITPSTAATVGDLLIDHNELVAAFNTLVTSLFTNGYMDEPE